MLESSQNDYVDLGMVSYKGTPWLLANDVHFLTRHRLFLAGFKYSTPGERLVKAQSMTMTQALWV